MKTTTSTPSAAGIKSGVTCIACGGLGHFARSFPSKVRSVKINVAVSKITTRQEYNQHLPETRKQVGNCPCCKQPAHSYSRKFPFGQCDWPTTRLDACPLFISKSPRERGELLERLKGCYKCLSWKHQGDACYLKSKSNCTVITAGTACSGIHNKMLHMGLAWLFAIS